MRWHLESAHLEQAEPAALRIGTEQLVDAQLGPMRAASDIDEKVTEQAVDEPWGRGASRWRGSPLELGERDLKLVQALVARLVDAWSLASGSDESPREQIRERRMVLPIGDDAAEQIGPAQEGAVGRRRAAEGQVIAAARSGVRPVEVERLGAEAGGGGIGVHAHGDVDELLPRRCRMNVDLENAGIGSDCQANKARVDRREVTLDHDRPTERGRRLFDDTKESDGVFHVLDRRHEHEEVAVARFDAERAARQLLRFDLLGSGARRRPQTSDPAARSARRTSWDRARTLAAAAR